MNIGGQAIMIEIQAAPSSGTSYLLVLSQLSVTYPVSIILGYNGTVPTGSGNTIVFSGATIASLYTNAGTLVPINSATLTLTVSAATQGSQATGSLTFPGPNGNIQGTITGTLTAIGLP